MLQANVLPCLLTMCAGLVFGSVNLISLRGRPLPLASPVPMASPAIAPVGGATASPPGLGSPLAPPRWLDLPLGAGAACTLAWNGNVMYIWMYWYKTKV